MSPRVKDMMKGLDHYHNVDNRTIRVLYLEIRPAVMNQCDRFPAHPSLRCRFPGYCVEIMSLLAKHLRIKIEPYKIINNTDVGTMVQRNNGTSWTGVLGMIENGTIDTTCTFFQKTVKRVESFDFTIPLYTTQTGLLLRRPGNALGGEMWNLFAPYSNYAWFTIIGFLFLQILLCVAITKIEWRVRLRQSIAKPSEICWRLLRMHLLQADGFNFFSISGKMTLFFFGLLQCLLVLSLYQFWIVSSLVRYVPTTTFRNVDEIFTQIVQGKFGFIVTYPGHWFYQQVLTSDDYRFKMLRNMEVIQKRPVMMKDNISELLDIIFTQPYVSVVQDDGPLKHYSSKYCELMSVKEGMSPMPTHLLFRRNSEWTRPFNEAITHERLHIQRIQDRYLQMTKSSRKRQCADYVIMRKKFRPLALVPFLGLLLICAFGFIVAIGACLFERYHHR